MTSLRDTLYEIISADCENRRFEIRLLPECFIYKAHFPAHPVTPGVCLIAMASELLGVALRHRLETVKVVNAKFLAVIDPRIAKNVTFTFSKIFDDGETVKATASVSDSETVYSKLSLLFMKS